MPTAREVAKWFGVAVLAIGAIWLVASIMLKNLASAGIGVLIIIVAIGVLLIVKKLV